MKKKKMDMMIWEPISLNAIAMKSMHHKHKHACILFLNGLTVVSTNNFDNHHAETRAIETAKLLGLPLKELTLLSVAVTKDGKFKLAKPCVGCQFQIKKAGIRKVFYSTKEQRILKL